MAKPNFNYLIFPSKPLTTEEFRNWIESRENGRSISLSDAKAKWAKKKKRLSKLIN